MWTNYFEMIPSPGLLLYRYNVEVQPAATGKKLTQIIRLLLQLPEYAGSRDEIVTDFKTTLVSRRRLSLAVPESTLQYRVEGEDEPRPKAQTYQLRIEETGTLTVSDLTDYLGSTNVNLNYTDKLPMLYALNIVLGHFAKSAPTITTVGSSKSFPLDQAARRRDLGAGLSALRGFFASVRVATCRILVNVNVSHGAFYNPIPLDHLIRVYDAGNLLKLQSFLRRVRVEVTHLPKKRNKAGIVVPRVKTIFGLATGNDGHSLDYPPRVSSFGEGPKGVEFFRKDSSEATPSSSTSQASGTTGGTKKGKGSKGGASTHGTGQKLSEYISVYDFFKTGICPPR